MNASSSSTSWGGQADKRFRQKARPAVGRARGAGSRARSSSTRARWRRGELPLRSGARPQARVLSQSRSALFKRVCHPRPVLLNVRSTSARQRGRMDDERQLFAQARDRLPEPPSPRGSILTIAPDGSGSAGVGVRRRAQGFAEIGVPGGGSSTNRRSAHDGGTNGGRRRSGRRGSPRRSM